MHQETEPERGNDGRFVHGNPGGPGRPRQTKQRELTERDHNAQSMVRDHPLWNETIATALEDAANGHSGARTWLSELVDKTPYLLPELLPTISDEKLFVMKVVRQLTMTPQQQTIVSEARIEKIQAAIREIFNVSGVTEHEEEDHREADQKEASDKAWRERIEEHRRKNAAAEAAESEVAKHVVPAEHDAGDVEDQEEQRLDDVDNVEQAETQEVEPPPKRSRLSYTSAELDRMIEKEAKRTQSET